MLELQLQQCSSNEQSGLISFGMHWLDLLEVQGTQESSPAPQLKTAILWRPAFSVVQLSRPGMTTGRAPALTARTFVGDVSAFNTLSRLV